MGGFRRTTTHRVECSPSVTTVLDERRDAAIEVYDVVRRPARQDLLALVELAALVCDVPMATINLITSHEQHQVAAVGFEASVCRREDSMCATTITLDEPVVISDASQDRRFRDNPFVTGESGNVRFYASHQLHTPDGTVIGTLCVFDEQSRSLSDEQEHALASLAERVVDALELELTTRRLRAANERMAASNERLAAFAGQLSHDLKNPLTAVTMSLELALEEADEVTDADMLVSLLDRAARGADRMQGMINDLLAFARGGTPPEVTQVDLAALMRDVLEDLAPVLGSATVEAGELPTVPGDPVQLHAVVQNLVANALKFTRRDVEPRVCVVAEELDRHWRVEVTDNGPGIPEDKQEGVFEPFARIDKSVPGTGVGLATCRRIVEAHGGTIGITTPPGGGTTVWFLLPSDPQPDGAAGSVPV